MRKARKHHRAGCAGHGFHSRSGPVSLHPGSFLSRTRDFGHDWLVYCEKGETSQGFVRDATLVSPYALLLFGGKLDVDFQAETITVDGWATFRAPPETSTPSSLMAVALMMVLWPERFFMNLPFFFELPPKKPESLELATDETRLLLLAFESLAFKMRLVPCFTQ